jgi:hypothetical protein
MYPALRNQTLVWYSDNVTGADNQQERLISLGWVTGFVDGEGCFSIGPVRQPHRENRVGYRTGYQLTHEFAVTQGEREYPLRTAKRADFDKFAYCVEQMDAGQHLTRVGLADLIAVAATMNRQKPRTELIRILRDHTPDPETSGEDMVPSAWRHAGSHTASASAQASLG